MNLVSWFKRLSRVNRISVIGVGLTLLGVILTVFFRYFPRSPVSKPHNVASIHNSPDSTIYQSSGDITVNSFASPAPRDVMAELTHPLLVEASAYDAGRKYRPGEAIAGISWQQEFVDVRLSLTNKTDQTLKEIDLFIQLDTHIAGIGQITDVPDVRFWGVGDSPSIWLEGTDEKGREVSVPILPQEPQISPVYRIHCPELLGGMSIRLLIAAVAVNPAIAGQLPKKLFAPRTIPRLMRLVGSYLEPDPKQPLKYKIDTQITLYDE